MSSKTTALRRLLAEEAFIHMPVAYDALGGRLIEKTGFKAAYVGGFVTGASRCTSEPLLTLDEQVRVAGDVAKSVGRLADIKLGMVKAVEGARLRKSVLGDICEAVIGAIYLDGGHEAARQFVERNWTERMHKLRRPLRDPKTTLQEWAQGKGLPTPVYREIERTGPHHDPQFRIAVELPGLASAETLTSGPVTPMGGVARLNSRARASTVLSPTVTDPGSEWNTCASNCAVCTLKPLSRNLHTT